MRALRNILLFLIGLGLTSAAISTIAKAPRIAIVTPKITWLADHGDEFDTLFLGSSRTYRQIIPELFDRGMAAVGQSTRSFNLGIDGMRPPEDTYVLEQILGHRKTPVRWVLVECNALRLSMREEDQETLRAVYWHDWKRLVTLFRRAFLADEKKRNWRDRVGEVLEVWPDFFEHAEYWAQRATHLGEGHDWLEKLMRNRASSPMPLFDLGPRRDGYRASESPEQMDPVKHAAYEQELAAMHANPPRVTYGDRVSQAELQEKKRLIEAAGGKMVLLIPPFAGSRFFHPQPGPSAPIVLDFSSPTKYPQLFAPEHHSDSGHVNRAGSELYTREIVRALLERL